MFLLVTNNSELFKLVKCGFFIDGTALDVLINVRSRIHFGSVLLTNPLCGNLRPNHQPFRSVLIDEKSGLVDLESLSLIENAIEIYQSCEAINPKNLDDSLRDDYAYIDCELLRESLEQYNLISKSQFNTAPLRTKNS